VVLHGFSPEEQYLFMELADGRRDGRHGYGVVNPDDSGHASPSGLVGTLDYGWTFYPINKANFDAVKKS